MALTPEQRQELQDDKLMLDIEKVRADLKALDDAARQRDKVEAREHRRTNIQAMAAGAGLTTAAAALMGAMLLLYNRLFG